MDKLHNSLSILSAVNVPARFTTVLEVPTIEITTISEEILPFTVGVASSGLNSPVGFTVFSECARITDASTKFSNKKSNRSKFK